MKALWQFIKFLVVSGLVTIIQLVLANVLPLIFDSVTATLPAFLQGIFAPNTIFDAATAKGVEQIGKYVVGGVIENGTVIGGVVTWGYLLPFFLSNLVANIYGFYQNKKTTFKSDAPWYNFAIYIFLMIALILFSTWFQGWLVGVIGRSSWGWLQALARTIASLAAGFVQMVVLFPMEKFVLLKEKKKDGEDDADADKKRKLRHNSTDEKGSRKRTFFVAHKNKSGRKNRSSYSRLFVINTNSDWLCGLSEKPRHIPVVVNVYFIRRRLLRESRHCHYVSCESHYKSGACRQADIAYRECEALRTAELLRVVRQRILRFRNTNRELVFAELFNFGNCFFRIRGEYNISGAVNLLCKNIQLFLYRKLFVIYGLKVSFFCLNRFNDLFGKLLSAFSAAGKYLRKRNRDVFFLAKSFYRFDFRFGIRRKTVYRNHNG